MRYGIPLELPEKCDGCGANFSLEHALQCKNGGLPIGRHNEVVQTLCKFGVMSIGDRNVQTEPIINPGSCISLKTNSHDNKNADGSGNNDRGDILFRGLHSNTDECIVDVRVTDTDAKSYRTSSPEKVIESQEKRKKSKYLKPCHEQRRSFTPFVVSVDGLMGREAKALLKRLAHHLTDKWKKPYSVVAGIVNAHVNVAIVRATSRCIRGSRISYKNMSLSWEDGSGTRLYQISE